MTHTPLRPVLVMMSYRGGERLARCLRSIADAQEHFSRIVLSITAPHDSDDMRMATHFSQRHLGIEVICTGRELPTMQHQDFWVDYLERTGARPSDWICWLAYDDELRKRGIEAIIDDDGGWPLKRATAYFGPWAMRHEQPDRLWDGDSTAPLESWTSFPIPGPTRLTVGEWIGHQLRQPTYMQMSGSVCPFASFLALRDSRPRKTGPMRIEMAIAAAPPTTHVEEFPEPVSVIYGRSNSDRAAYGKGARKEDVHLATWLGRLIARHPSQGPALARAGAGVVAAYAGAMLGRRHLPEETWVVRGFCDP